MRTLLVAQQNGIICVCYRFVIVTEKAFLRDTAMAIVLPLNEMTVEEKLQALEAIWDDLSRNAQNLPSPAWHKELLEARLRDVEEGRDKFYPWEEVRRIMHEEIR
jgi:putative addiction module component (TIGR02574 family)